MWRRGPLCSPVPESITKEVFLGQFTRKRSIKRDWGLLISLEGMYGH